MKYRALIAHAALRDALLRDEAGALARADAVLAATALAQLQVRRPHLMTWARRPASAPPPAFSGAVILEAAVVRVVVAVEQGEEPPAHALAVLGAFLHPEMHRVDSWHPERTFYASLPAPWSREALGALLGALPAAVRQRCLLEADPVPWPYLRLDPADALLTRAVAEVAAWTRKPEGYEDEEVVQGLVAVGEAARPHLMAALEAGGGAQRGLLVRALAALNAPEAARTWAHLLADSRAELRAQAAQSLAELGAALAVPLVRPLLQSRRKGLRYAAAQALAAMPREAPEVQRAADDALQQEADPATRALLLPLASAAEAPGLVAWRALRASPRAARHRYLSLYQNPPPVDAGDPTWLAGAGEELIREPLSGHLPLWEHVLRSFAGHPAAPWAAVEVMAAFMSARVAYMDQHLEVLTGLFGDGLAAPILDLLQSREHPMGATFLGWLASRGVAAAGPLYLAALQRGTPAEQDAATRGLAGQGEAALPGLLPLLGSRRKATRQGAALALRRIASREAAAALAAALEVERDAATRDALQAALDASRGTPRAALPPLQTPWDVEGQEDPSAVLEQFRELLHDPLGRPGWAQLWCLIDRAAASNALELALDYARSHLRLASRSAWEVTAPWHWRDDPALLILLRSGEEVEAGSWVTVDAVLRGRAGAWLEAVLPQVEHNTRARPLGAEGLEVFTAALRGAWRICAEHGIDPGTLALRVDGGAARRGTTATPRTTALTLVDGYAVHVGRCAAHIEAEADAPGLRVAFAPLPADHPARDAFNLGEREGGLNLRPLL